MSRMALMLEKSIYKYFILNRINLSPNDNSSVESCGTYELRREVLESECNTPSPFYNNQMRGSR